MTRLSVIVPFYNAVQFIPTASATIRNNLRDDTEFVLVEDCSTDRTREVLRARLGDLDSVRIVELDRNSGLASARNAGLEVAQGRYVTFLDADDWAAPGHFCSLADEIESLGCSFVRTDHVTVSGRGRRIARSPETRRSVVFSPRDAILPSDRPTGVDYPYAWAGIYDTNQISKEVLRFDDGLHTAEDRPWIWRLYLEAESHAVVPHAGVFYRRDVTNSLTQIGDRRQLDFLRAFDQVLNLVEADRERDRFMPKAVRSYCAVLAHHLRQRGRMVPEIRRELWIESARSLDRLPDDVLDEVLTEMGDRRAFILRWLDRAGDVIR